MMSRVQIPRPSADSAFRPSFSRADKLHRRGGGFPYVTFAMTTFSRRTDRGGGYAVWFSKGVQR